MTPRITLSGISEVLRAAGLLIEVHGSEDAPVLGTSQDSRAVRAGDLFLAWAGTAFDPHDHLAAVAEAGAVGAVVERPVDVAIPQLVVRDGRAAGAIVADVVAGSPWRAMPVVGITGTNGKTTTTWLVRHLLSADRATASLGTLGLIGPDGTVRPGTEGLTTPGPVQLSGWMRDLAADGAKALVMEASSHALEQRRLAGVRFAVACFTNLTQDHLDYHGDMESYAAAKRMLADLLDEGGVLVVNDDEPAWAGLAARPGAIRWSTRADSDADLVADGIVASSSGTHFLVRHDGRTLSVRLPLIGAFNVENTLAALGVAVAMGVALEDAVARLESVPQIPGRLQIVAETPITVLIDFAHTPDALRNVLDTLRRVTRGRLIVLFGAGGDRDRGKRPLMGEAVAAYADLAVLTSDNPRTEDPERILDDVRPGLTGVEVLREVDRRRAIALAVESADEGDVVVLAGKGHEAYQIVGTEKFAFDERAIALAALDRRGAA